LEKKSSDPRFMSSNELNIQYLSGKVQGDMIYDTVKTGDVSVQHQIVGVAKVVDIVLLDDVVWDGILGLAYPNPSLTNQGIIPFFDTVISQHVLSSKGLANQFAYYIDDTHGSVTFGGVNCDLLKNSNFRMQTTNNNKQACIEQFHFVPITEKTYWTVTLHDVRVQYPNKPAMTIFCSGGCKAIIDTGTYLLYGPEGDVRRMLNTEVDGCVAHDLMPTFYFDFFSGHGQQVLTLALRPIDYILKFENNGHDECVMGISPDKDTIWTLGQVFLRSFYTLFDRDGDRVGFARIPRETFQAINTNRPIDYM